MTTRNSRHGWPALMKAATARAYLDDMPVAEFAANVAPFLDARSGIDCVRYTRDSLDAWIGSRLLTRSDVRRRTGWSPDKLARILRENPTLEVVGAGRGMQFTEQQFAAVIAAVTRRGTYGKNSTRQAPERGTGTGSPAGRTRTASATRSTSARRTRELLDEVLGEADDDDGSRT